MIKTYLEKLIQFKTISKDLDANHKALSWIIKEIKDLPLFIKEYKNNGFSSLIITTRKTKSPHILLAAHMDVVNGSDDIFQMKVKGGKVFGRGSFDMKYAIAIYLTLLKNLGDDLTKLDLAIMITSDEELGGFNGVNYLLSKKGYDCNICILPDGGKDWQLVTETKGILQLKIIAKGKSAHSSKIWLGRSATHDLIDFIAKLRQNKMFNKDRYETSDSFAEHYYNTINVGKITGGDVANQVVDHAEALLDIRFVSQEREYEIFSLVQNIAEEFPHISLEKKITGNPVKVDTNNKYIKKFTRIAADILGEEIKPSLTHGTSDARFFEKHAIPVIITRPVGGGHHSEEEWISEKGLIEFYQIIERFVLTNMHS